MISKEKPSGLFSSMGLKKKFVLTAALVILLLGIIITIFVHINQTSNLRYALNKEGISIARNLSVIAEDTILTEDIVGLQRMINDVMNLEEDVTYIFILDTDGFALVHTFDLGVPAVLKDINPLHDGEAHSSKLLDTEHGFIRDIAVPIGNLGTLRVGISENIIRQTVTNTTWTLSIITLLIMLLGMLLGSFIVAWELKPLNLLTEGVGEIGSGNLDYRIDINTTDEIGVLATEFNQMAQDLKLSQDKLKKWNIDLELLVQERTRAFRESESRFQALCDSAQDAIIILNRDGEVTFWNESAEKIFGYTKDEMIGKEIDDHIIPGQYREKHLSTFGQFNEDGGRYAIGKTLELTALRKSGEEFPMEVSVSVVKLDGDWNTIGILRDITKRRQIEEEKQNIWQQLLQSQKLEPVGRLAGGIVHDFNNILAAIIGYCHLALAEVKGHPAEEKLKIIKNAGERASKLIGQLLAFSRKQVLEMKVTNLNNIVEGLVKMLSRMIGEDIELELKTGSSVSNVLADEIQIEQVLMNLAVNARHAMPNGGTLTIETRDVKIDKKFAKTHFGAKTGDYIMLSVTDTGIGMSDEIKDKIFEPFFTTKPKGEGTGLGLSTVFGIVKQHNGYLSVDTKVNKGSVFKIYLPKTEGKIKEEGVYESSSMKKGLETILVVDDDKVVLSLAVEILEPLDYNVLTAENTEQAMNIINNGGGDIDLIVTDVVMPGANGWELYQKIRRDKRDIKTIFISGYLENPIVLENILNRKLPFIRKPFTPQGFVNILRKVLDEPVSKKNSST